MTDVLFIARIMQTHNLSDVMVGAILTGKDSDGNDQVVQAGPKQIKALVERNFVGENGHYLTEKGQMVYQALNGEELTDEEKLTLLVSTGTTSSRSTARFLVDFEAETIDGMVIPSDNGEGVPWAEAKDMLRDHFIAVRNRARIVLKEIPKLRKADITSAPQTEGFDSLESDDDVEESPAESLFQAPVG